MIKNFETNSKTIREVTTFIFAQEKLFYENGQAKIFTYKNFTIYFDLKLIASDVNSVSDKYEKYWLGNNDFSFLKI